MPVFLRPDADVLGGGWTNESGGSTLFSGVNESSVNDANYIRSPLNPTSADTCKLSFDNPSGSLTALTIRYRYKKEVANATVVNWRVRLLQGASEIASWTANDISASYVTGEQTLSAPQLALITDPTDLILELIPNPSVFEMTDIGSDLSAWFDAQGGIYMTLSGGDVTQWTDRSGNGRHLSRSGSFTSPVYASNAVDFAPVADTKCLNVWAVDLPSTLWDCYLVADPLPTVDGGRVLFGDDQGNVSFFGVTGAPLLAVYDGSTKQFGALTWSDALLRQAMCSHVSDSVSEASLNGDTVAQITGLAWGAYARRARPTIGNQGTSGLQGFGKIYEMVFTTSGLGAANRSKVQGRLAWKWDGILGGSALVSALPVGHTYKSAAP